MRHGGRARGKRTRERSREGVRDEGRVLSLLKVVAGRWDGGDVRGARKGEEEEVRTAGWTT